MLLNANRHWDQCQNFDRHWALIEGVLTCSILGLENYSYSTKAGLSKFFGITLVPGLVESQVGKSEAMTVKSRFYAFPPN